ncbi:magnesium transporter MgtE N-terminal domain-containing protein [Isoptericola variabilis]|uniref:MgtE intracellular region n=1 Tax=Isoptericola variabilis (strain 225) TaxID=743718 RepID=F6FX96_ISOV2|nr:CBS domain-containing protein [Isoptericola variabilis]AEG43599.1 MgtE intracellular region [Isoptericola variabilis 225]TWH32033.1 Mg/Co/Ni transporter MgtE (contains CBS domain) [Isoptericola variabilis J7]
MSATTRVFVARLAGTPVFDPIGDQVGRVRDVVVLVRAKGPPRAVGLVVEVPGRRRIFLPLTRVTSIDSGQVITTGLVNIRRFEKRAMESLVLGELLDRTVRFKDGSGEATIEDLSISRQRTGDWLVDQLFVRRRHGQRGIGLRRRGETLVVPVDAVTGLATSAEEQGAARLLEAYEDLRPADLADALHELGDVRRLEVAAALDDERLADVLGELPEDDQVAILSALDSDRAADVLEAMQPDDAADLLHELPDEQAARLLELMEPEEAEDVRRLLAYAEDTAGGLMTTEPVILGPETPIATALAHIRRQDLPPALASMVFVVRPPLETPTGRFLGVAHFQRLLREPPHAAIGSVLDDDTEWLTPEAPIGRVTRLLAAYDLLALPVLDSQKRLLGAVSVDDVLDHILPDDWREQHDDEQLEEVPRG